ncbi:MAG: 3-oxoacyl-(acyl-carrier-protein) reductase FabG [Firmicutes bacterium]|nr:3-oxoacyl-(acyl-carrier-protein) reductase FabG [Bacillota bacterium]
MKVVLVTGGAGGIGRATCQLFAERGFMVLVHYNASQDEALAITANIKSQGFGAEVCRANLADEAEVNAMVAGIVATYGRIDVVVNNAGIARDSLVLTMKLSDWQDVLEVNLTGAFLVCRAVAKVMLRQRFGKIINVSSVVGLTGNVGQANYAAAKAGLIGFTKSLAKELARRGITCNAVAPGFIDAGMAAVLPAEVKKALLATIPQGRPGTPAEVACAIAFLASAEADYITGQVLRVDGGMSM